MKKNDFASYALRVTPEKHILLKDVDPDRILPGSTKEKAAEFLQQTQKELNELQLQLYAEQKQSLLLIFQAMDTGGKDGAIRNLFTGLNPAGVQITSFKAPTSEDLKYDYLKRIHHAVPPKGLIGVWNRSHYEDVLIVRVHGMINKTVCQERLEDITSFEKMLSRNGTTIVKFFLHISKEEQRRRLQERLDNPEKHWKFDPADLEERALWSDYRKAYEDAINATSSSFAPWYIVPADHKWVRSLIISSIVVETLRAMNPRFPKAKFVKKKTVVV
jgi:PPK2 family polyphosphate:nucleotide phosphotransferase